MGTHPIFESDFDCLTEMSRRSSSVNLGSDAIRKLANELFSALNKGKWNEAKELLKMKSKLKLVSRDFKSALTELIESEEAYSTDLDKSLIPDTSRFRLPMNRKKDLESSFSQTQQRFVDIPEYEFLFDFCQCRIQLVKLYIQLYQNSAGKPNIATDFPQIYELFVAIPWSKKEHNFQRILERYPENKIVFDNVRLEVETLEYVLQAANDISALHIISA